MSSVEATKAAIERLQACHELTHCIIALEADEALAAAKAADAAIAKGSAKGPLAGVPLAHKDMFDRKGKIASWGAKIRADKPAAEDATAIARFKAAGALQIAALHLAEFAYGPTGHNYVLGHARNPWDPTRITGGSSAGTAAARWPTAPSPPASAPTPAARCACRPPAAASPRSSRPGAASAAPAPCRWRLRSTPSACIARHVEDLALTLGFLAGPDPRDPAASTLPVPDYVARLDDPVKGLRDRHRRDRRRRGAPATCSAWSSRCSASSASSA